MIPWPSQRKNNVKQLHKTAMQYPEVEILEKRRKRKLQAIEF